MRIRVKVVVSSQLSDFSRRASHPTLPTKTAGSVPNKESFTCKSIPNGTQGSLIHSIGRGLGAGKKKNRETKSDQTPP